MKIINTAFYSIGFPQVRSSEFIERSNYFSQFDDKFENGSNLIILEGKEDSGKTTICAQFALRNIETSISIFFNPHHKLDYSLEFYCSNFIYQAKHILGVEQPENIERLLSVEEYNQTLFALRKSLRSSKKKITLIIDGLEEKINENNSFIVELMNIIPFGENIFRIIISGNEKDYLKIHKKLAKQNIESIDTIGFSPLEIEEFLKGINLSDTERSELSKITHGLPGRLNTIRRILTTSNTRYEDVLNSNTYGAWLELDCNSVNLDNPFISSVISLLSLSDKSYPSDELAKICCTTKEEIDKLILTHSILEKSGDNIKLISNGHKNYFAGILRGNKSKVEEMLINYYVSDGSVNSIIELPKLHAKSKDWSKVLDVLDADYLPRIIENTGSLLIVNESLKLGIQASDEINKYGHLWRYSIQGGIVNELDNFLFWESEIEARIAISDFTGSILLAESAVLKIDRLRLLALIAKRQKQLNNSVDEELTDLIKDLYAEIDLFNVGEKIYDIVGDLLYAMPNLAIEIIEKSSDSMDNGNINDWIVTKLSFAAIDSSLKENDQSENSKKLEAIQSLNNPKVKKINKAISFLVGNYSADKVILEVNKLEDSNEKLRLLRLWLNNNKSNIIGVENVMDLALDQLIEESSSSAITVDLLKELSNNLPFLKNEKEQKELCSRFQNLEKNVKESALSKNKYIFQLNIIHTQFNLNNNAWKSKLNELIKEVDGIEDTLIKLDSYAEIYSKLTVIKEDSIGKKIGFLYAKIIELAKVIFNETGSHYKASEYLLKIIGKKNPVLGLKICDLINTEYRREKGKILLVESYLDNNLKNVKIDLLKKIESSLINSDSKEILLLNVLERYSEAKSLHFNTIKDLLHFGKNVNYIKDNSKKTFGYILGYKILVKNNEWKSKMAVSQEDLIYSTWNSIEADWQKIDVGFKICSEISEISPVFANKIFNESVQLKKSSWINSEIVARTYQMSISVILKAFLNLCNSSENTKNEFKTVETIIARIPSNVEKLLLWTELGFQAYISDKNNIAKNILDNHILPIIDDLKSKKNDLSTVITSICYVHLFNSELAERYANDLSINKREALYGQLCYFYLTKRCPFDIYEEGVLKYQFTYSDISKTIEILKKVTNDSNIYDKINHISKAIKSSKNILSSIQIGEIVKELSSIVNISLPDIKNIKHDGFKILSQLKIDTIQPKGIDNKTHWKKVFSEVKNIPNISDRIFVNSVLLEDIPFDKIGDENFKVTIFKNIIEELNKLTVHYEFVQRIIDISDVMYRIDRVEWKKMVDKAFLVSGKLEEGSEVYESQKNIIDSMYRLDPDYAKRLIQSIDNKTNDKNISKLVKDHYQSLNLASKIKNNTTILDKEKANSRLVIKAIIDSIRSLNSGRMTAKKIKDISGYLKLGNSSLTFHEIFPVYMYYLINCGITYRLNKSVGPLENIHLENFSEAVKASELIHLFSRKRKINSLDNKKFFIDEEFVENQLVKPETREEAINFIKTWMEETVEEFILIADPYFVKEDLEILKIVKECCNNDIEIDILGSKAGPKTDTEIEFTNYWNYISAELPPFTKITFCWIPDKGNDTPFHDRWVLTKNGGLRLGTSLNSMGIGKESELSVMTPNEALNIRENSLKEYISAKKRELNNHRLAYKSFSL